MHNSSNPFPAPAQLTPDQSWTVFDWFAVAVATSPDHPEHSMLSRVMTEAKRELRTFTAPKWRTAGS